jgi:5-methylcytosine-specific restriction protein A
MDLYLKYRPSAPDQSNSDVIALSEILNSLPIHTERPDIEKFRNPNGVSMKMGNFQALDPDYQGVGLSRGAKADAEVWDYFIERRGELKQLAASLRQAAASGNAPIAEEEGEDEVEEGKIVFRTHRARERNPQLRKRKIEAVVREKGELACLVCGFNFATTYGEELGGGFIEVHHVTPLSELGGVTKTRLKDLAVVCSNCHRMLHRAKPWLQPQELQGRLNQ